MLSYVWVRIRPPKDQTHFEGWTAARFGWRLYRIFFKTYTEKAWGIPATELTADFAAQRIKNLSLGKAIWNALLPRRNQKDITSLIEEFEYPQPRPRDDVGAVPRPRRGPGHEGADGGPRDADPPRGRPRGVRHGPHGRRRDHRGGRPRHLVDADHRPPQGDGPARSRGGGSRSRRPPVPRLPHRRAGGARGGSVPGQLDLHPRSGGEGRPHPELRAPGRRTS